MRTETRDGGTDRQQRGRERKRSQPPNPRSSVSQSMKQSSSLSISQSLVQSIHRSMIYSIAPTRPQIEDQMHQPWCSQAWIRQVEMLVPILPPTSLSAAGRSIRYAFRKFDIQGIRKSFPHEVFDEPPCSCFFWFRAVRTCVHVGGPQLQQRRIVEVA